MNKNIGKIISCLVINSLILFSVYSAVSGSIGWGNITKFLASVTLFLGPLVIIISLYTKDELTKVEEWISHIIDAVTVVTLAWYGWFWCAGAFAFGWLCCAISFELRKK